ncbi:MAG TPA: DUF4255 domain-containing protein [Allosphingosinicella sp.]
MANGFALPALSHVLRRLLLDAAPQDDLSFLGATGWQVSMLAPDLVKRGDKDPPLLNLFLYQVGRNSGWHNRDARTYDGGGNRIAAPPLALDLRYLVTAYGNKAYQAEALLAHALLALHDRPTLTRAFIADSLELPPAPDKIEKQIAASGLAEQAESVQLSVDNLSIDELSRLWSGFNLGLRPSVSLLATVLLLSSRRTPRPAAPVAARTITTVPLGRPVIETVAAEAGAHLPIEPGTRITLSGEGLYEPSMVLLLGGIDAAALLDKAAPGFPTTLTLALPASLPAGMLAGVQTAQVRHGVRIAGEASPRPLLASNLAAFLLRPRVAAAAEDGGTERAILVDFAHEIGDRQSVSVTLEEVVGGALTGNRFAATVPEGNPDAAPPEDLPRPPRVDLRRVWARTSAPAGTFRVLASVDGIASVPHALADDPKVTLS